MNDNKENVARGIKADDYVSLQTALDNWLLGVDSTEEYLLKEAVIENRHEQSS